MKSDISSSSSEDEGRVDRRLSEGVSSSDSSSSSSSSNKSRGSVVRQDIIDEKQVSDSRRSSTTPEVRSDQIDLQPPNLRNSASSSASSHSSRKSSSSSSSDSELEERVVSSKTSPSTSATSHHQSPSIKPSTPSPNLPTLPPKSSTPLFRSSSSSSRSSSSSSSSSSSNPPSTPRKPMTATSRSPSTSEDETKQSKEVPDEPFERPKAAHPKSARFSNQDPQEGIEPVASELHVVRFRKTRSAPVRSRGFYAQSSNLVFLQKECNRIERQMVKMAKVNLANRPKITPYKPFTWNSLAPYYNTDTLRYIIHMPVPVRRGYNTRATASGLVDPETSWRMDHSLTPTTPSRPELFRHHYVNKRSQSAKPRMTSDNSLLTPRFPRINSSVYNTTSADSKKLSTTRSHSTAPST